MSMHLTMKIASFTNTEVAVEWIDKAKMVGFPFMLAAQNFNIAGSSSSVAIVQRT